MVPMKNVCTNQSSMVGMKQPPLNAGIFLTWSGVDHFGDNVMGKKFILGAM